jgi:hypothetical protein
MADLIKRGMNKRCGVGGIKCRCCNDYHGKDKPKLMRMVRRTLKLKLKGEIT